MHLDESGRDVPGGLPAGPSGLEGRRVTEKAGGGKANPDPSGGDASPDREGYAIIIVPMTKGTFA
jgi:hypothetical protein